MSLAKLTLGSAFAGLFSLLVAASPAQAASLGQTVVAAPDRTEEDRKEDERRHPAELTDFSGVKPGMTVLDMMAGGGYTTEVFARAVGPAGKVYAQNAAGTPEKFTAALPARTKKPGIHIIPVEAPIEAPVPADVHDLDMITLVLNYHDIAYMPVDRAKMNKAIFAGLKHGGSLIIVDHAAKAGDGANVGKTLHRIEESTLVGEVEAAGFKKAAEGDFLRVPSDPKDQPFFKMDGKPTDQFVLKFTKP